MGDIVHNIECISLLANDFIYQNLIWVLPSDSFICWLDNGWLPFNFGLGL